MSEFNEWIQVNEVLYKDDALPECENSFEHTLHLYGFSPVCIRMWIVRPPE